MLPFSVERTTRPSRLIVTLENASDGVGCTVNDRCGSGLSSLNMHVGERRRAIDERDEARRELHAAAAAGTNWVPCFGSDAASASS